MAFTIHKMDVGLTAPYECRHTATALTDGMAAKLTAGELVQCGATERPDYIVAGPKDEGGFVPCVKVQDYMIFKTELSALGSSLKEGKKVTIAEDGLRVTATEASGVATIDHMEGTAAGDAIYVRF